MKRLKKKQPKNYSQSKNYSRSRPFSSPLVLGFTKALGSSDPIEAMRTCAQALLYRSELKQPPFRPSVYAHLRSVNRIIYKEMEAEGHLIRNQSGFTIELRRDRSHERKNFTCAHEVGHTFFFEVVPSMKESRIATHAAPDEEEEFLCNVAASELLMPFESLKTIALDYMPSPKSLKELAGLYETSITAMAVRLICLNLWQAKFILWERVGQTIRARWIVEPNRTMTYFPRLELENYERSSINDAFHNDETVEGEEWVCNERRFIFCSMASLRIGEDRVLSCAGSFKKQRFRQQTAITTLPMNYACTCNGTGTRLIFKGGRTYATKCLADYHNIPSLTGSNPWFTQTEYSK